MALVATIAGTDRANFIQWNSLLIENILTNQLDQCFFTIRNTESKTFIPSAGQEVIITLDGTRVFGGTIVRVNEVSPMFGTNELRLYAQTTHASWTGNLWQRCMKNRR